MGKKFSEEELIARDNIKCKICGKLAKEDSHFYYGTQLCNRHYLQIVRHGDVLLEEKERTISFERVCSVCGDTHHNRYYVWHEQGKYYQQSLCGKHYNQMLRNGKIIDNTPSKQDVRIPWTDKDIEILKEMYLSKKKIVDIANVLGRTTGSVSSKAEDIGLTKVIIKPNNPNFKAVYQDYDWCFERYINRGMTMQDMADEAGASLRVVQKWCQEIHNLDNRSYKKHKKLNDFQKQLIMFGRLGDGHIDRREDQPMYIESHAENQKDYIFWKWSILKDLCTQEPVYYPPKATVFGGKSYACQASYRLCTRIIDDLKPIREMSNREIIEQLNEFGIAIHFLDDASRSDGFWTLCVAGYPLDDINKYLKICENRFNIIGKIHKDSRYVGFNKSSSKIIDNIILKIVPNNLDIIQSKIFRKKLEVV